MWEPGLDLMEPDSEELIYLERREQIFAMGFPGDILSACLGSHSPFDVNDVVERMKLNSEITGFPLGISQPGWWNAD